MTPQEYNRRASWRGHWPGGLRAGLLAGIDPASERFALGVESFQRTRLLTADGKFGPLTQAEYFRMDGFPAIQRGCDVSGWQDAMTADHWRRLWSEAGIRFAWVKQSQGLRRSRGADVHCERLRAAGFERISGYCYSEWDGAHRPYDECAFFVARLERNGLFGTGLPAVFDFESKGYKKPKNTGDSWRSDSERQLFELWERDRPSYQARARAYLVEWLDAWAELTGGAPLVLYSYGYYLRERLGFGSSQSLDVPLLIAYYRCVDDPRIEYGLSSDWTIYGVQHTSDGSAETRAIYDHGLDLDYLL